MPAPSAPITEAAFAAAETIRHRSSTAHGSKHKAGDSNAALERAKRCHCTQVQDVTSGETAEIVLHIQAKPNFEPVHVKPPRVAVQVLRDLLGRHRGLPPDVECSESSVLLRSAPSMRLRYGPLRQAGPFLLAVTIDGAHVAGSPFMLRCRPSTAVGEHCSFDDPAISVRAGEVARLMITTRDRFDNRCAAGGAHVAVHDASPAGDPDRLQPPLASVTSPSRTQPSLPERAHYHEQLLAAGEAIEIVDHKDGTYEARVLLRQAGTRFFVGSVHGMPFDGPPLQLTVRPAALHAPCCVP